VERTPTYSPEGVRAALRYHFRYQNRVVEVRYQAGVVGVKFVGTHAQYDRIDVEAVNDD